MKPKVFIDGEAGTTGLQIAARLNGRADLEVIQIDEARRKDLAARAAIMKKADAVILCLPDDAARLAVSLVENPNTVIIDASPASASRPAADARSSPSRCSAWSAPTALDRLIAPSRSSMVASLFSIASRLRVLSASSHRASRSATGARRSSVGRSVDVVS